MRPAKREADDAAGRRDKCNVHEEARSVSFGANVRLETARAWADSVSGARQATVIYPLGAYFLFARLGMDFILDMSKTSF